MITLNERIREVRKCLGLSQSDFAKKVGISQRSVSWGEQPGNNVPDSTIKSLCIVFRINEAWLRTGEGDMFEQPDTFSLDRYLKEKGCTALEMEIVRAYFDLDYDTRQMVFEHFRARLSAAAAAPPEEAPPEEAAPLPLELKSPADMTDAEIDQLAEQMRQEMHREKEAVGRSPALPGFGTSSSGPPIAGSGGGPAGKATG